MPTLGDVLAMARRSAQGFDAWIEGADPELAATVREASADLGEPPEMFARAAVGEFDRHASEDDWATLTRAIRDSEDPAAACLGAMVRWRLAAKHHACPQHS